MWLTRASEQTVFVGDRFPYSSRRAAALLEPGDERVEPRLERRLEVVGPEVGGDAPERGQRRLRLALALRHFNDLIAVAHPENAWAPESSATVWSGPLAKLGASLTGVTVMVNVCGSLVSSPPLSVPPSSDSVTVTFATPLAFGARAYVSVPFGETAGWTLNSALLSLLTWNVRSWSAS